MLLGIAAVVCCFGAIEVIARAQCETAVGWNCTNLGGGCCSSCIAAIMDDIAAIEKWNAEFKLKYPLCDIDLFESPPDRVAFGHPSLNNCLLCGGQW